MKRARPVAATKGLEGVARTISTRNRNDLEGLHLLSDTGQRVHWVLREAKDAGQTHSLTAAEVHELLSLLEVATSKNSVAVSLTRATNRTVVARLGADGFTRYSIAHAGRELLAASDPRRGIQVWRAAAGDPWRGWQKLEDLARTLKGSLLLVDPYFGDRTLATLEVMAPGRGSVRHLTAHIASRKGRPEGAILAAARAFVKSHPNVEIRRATPPARFHDRFVLSSDSLVLVGHGLENLGDKESFVVSFPVGQVADLASALKVQFEAEWSSASAI